MAKVMRWLGILVIGVLVVAVVYLGMQIYSIFNPNYRTETAIYYQMSENIQMTAAAVFEKQRVDGTGMMGYLVEDGERVHPGQLIAEIYATPEQAQARLQYKQLEQQLQMLESSEKIQGADVGAITRQLQDGLYALLSNLDSGNYAMASNDFDTYLIAANKVQFLTGKVEGFAQQKQEIQSKMQSLETATGSPQLLTAPASGYFVRGEQAGVQPFTQQQLEEMTPQQLQQELQKSVPPSPPSLGRIITDYRWYIYGTTDSDLSKQLKVGQMVKVRLAEKGGLKFSVKVENIQKDSESELCKIKLSCQTITPEALSIGIEQMELVVNEYEGIRVPRSAEHIRQFTDENGKEMEEYGVYVKLGNLMYFRKISNKLYQNEEYMLLPLDSIKENGDEVRLYDEIIVEGVDLEHGKLI